MQFPRAGARFLPRFIIAIFSMAISNSPCIFSSSMSSSHSSVTVRAGTYDPKA